MHSNIDLKEITKQAKGMFLYFSELLKKDVKSSDGKIVGKLWDVTVTANEIYPRFVELIICDGLFNRKYASVPWKSVAEMDDDMILDKSLSEISFSSRVKAHDFLLKRDVLDQQVVDTFNHKVRRVNDIHLLKVEHDLMVAHVDIGLRGLMRRLDWEPVVDLVVRSFDKRSEYLSEDNLVSWKSVQPVSVNPASMTMKLSFSEKQLLAIPAVDLAEMMLDLNFNQRLILFKTLDLKTKAKIFENLDNKDREEILKELDKKEAAAIISNMPSDNAADLMEALPNQMVRNLLTLMESTMARKLSTLLGYSGDSAGGIMTAEYVFVHDTATIESALDHVRHHTKEQDTVPYIYIIDSKSRLKGATTVRRLLAWELKDTVIKAAFPKVLSISLGSSVKDIAFMMDKYKLSSIPVVDENKVMHGVITMDDILSRVIAIAWRKRKPKGL